MYHSFIYIYNGVSVLEYMYVHICTVDVYTHDIFHFKYIYKYTYGEIMTHTINTQNTPSTCIARYYKTRCMYCLKTLLVNDSELYTIYMRFALAMQKLFPTRHILSKNIAR